MPVTDSRQGPGTLSLGTLTAAECQMANVRLVPEQNEEDGTPTLCEPEPVPLITTTWNLAGSAVQDWELDSTVGFVEFCRVNNNSVVAFEWTPNTVHGVVYSGDCQIRAVEIGGDVGTQNVTDFEFPVQGQPQRNDLTP
jgi:hypothetical protein